jgi:outer membrane protein
MIGIWRALVIAGLVLLYAACGGPRIGVVDSQRILDESALALTYQRELDSREKVMAEDLRLLVGKLQAQDLEARRQIYLRELSTLKGELEGRLNERIRKEVSEVARRERLRYVFVKGATRWGGVDITQDVIDRLR